MGESKTHCQFQLPDCWNDDVRMTALFAPPRSESINPHDWTGKLKFWKELILKWATENNQLIITLEMLNEAFCRKGKYPVSLSRVLEEMNRQGDISTRDVYMCDTTNSSWTSWGLGLVKTSVAWSWRKVISSLTEVEKGTINYVVPKVLEERSDRVLELPEASSEDVIDLEELRDLYPDMFSNEDETHIVLYHLQKKGKIVVDASTPDTMIKFIPSSNSVNKTPIAKRTSQQQQNTPVWNSSPLTLSKEKPSAEITEIDRSLATLRRTEMLLENEIDDLENQMQALEQTARTRLKEGARGAAKAALYRRKQLQAIVDKRNQALTNIQSMKLQLAQAKTDNKVMEAYKIGLSALKKSFGDMPLDEDKVQDTLFELETVLEQHRDIENALSQTINSADDATESDLEDELMNILSEAPKQESEEEPELVLPSAPTDSPKAEAEPSMARQLRLPAQR